ncbi:glycine-rich selenoprotein-like, partial [Centruroides sculpturatus]|uniref:glycine-rich selenoprotein-like n=1 Tax=Centruroides sculpturatus TaxID=218467 RepID=UPI000C6EDF2E
MPYVNERGMVSGSQSSWGLSKLTYWFWEICNIGYLFLRTLIEPAIQQGSSSWRSSGGGRSGGGGFGGGGGGGGRGGGGFD